MSTDRRGQPGDGTLIDLAVQRLPGILTLLAYGGMLIMLTGADSAVFPGGHLGAVEHPEEFAERLATLLTRNTET